MDYLTELQQLRLENVALKEQLKKITNEFNAYKDEVSRRRSNAQTKDEKYQNCINTLKRLTLQDASQLFTLKKYPVMNITENRMFFDIRAEVKKQAYSDKYGYINVFSQISLHAFLDRTNRGIQYDAEMEDDILLKQFLSKSVDFLLCSTKKINTQLADKDYIFSPILAIEIDGPFHSEPKQKENDAVKNALFDAAKIPLLRHILSDNKDIQEEIRQILL